MKPLSIVRTEILEEIGFSKGEVKVYFALIELGETTIGPISTKSGITPSKVYPIFEKLMKKGLVTYIIKSGTKHFQGAKPQRIIDYLEKRKKEIDEEKEEIKELIPQIEAKQKLSKEFQTAEVYQTFDGIRTLYNDIIETLKETKEDFIAFTLGEEEYKHRESEYFFQEYDGKRRMAGIKIRLLGHISQKEFLKSVTKDDRNISVRYLSYQLPTGVIIYGNKVATLVWGETPTAFVIQSKQASNSYKKFFEDMWKSAKP
jgi:HTH-type transcriptional regulator, sugar sensing transcriptional regulator